MIYAIAGIAFLGFIVWAHHMFQSGMNPTLGTTFAISTMFIAVPSAIKTFNWLGTLPFWLSFIAYNCTFFPMHILGIGGMPRRVWSYINYDSFVQYRGINEF